MAAGLIGLYLFAGLGFALVNDVATKEGMPVIEHRGLEFFTLLFLWPILVIALLGVYATIFWIEFQDRAR